MLLSTAVANQSEEQGREAGPALGSANSARAAAVFGGSGSMWGFCCGRDTRGHGVPGRGLFHVCYTRVTRVFKGGGLRVRQCTHYVLLCNVCGSRRTWDGACRYMNKNTTYNWKHWPQSLTLVHTVKVTHYTEQRIKITRLIVTGTKASNTALFGQSMFTFRTIFLKAARSQWETKSLKSQSHRMIFENVISLLLLKINICASANQREILTSKLIQLQRFIYSLH